MPLRLPFSLSRLDRRSRMIGWDVPEDRSLLIVQPSRDQAEKKSRAGWPDRYRTFAMVCVNTALAGLFVLLVLHFLLPVEELMWDQNLGGQRLSRTFVEAHYYSSDSEATAGILRDWDRYILNGHWQVHPWTGLINREFTGRYLSVSADGRRGGIAPDAARAALGPYVVWVFGGSTVFGWGLPDSSTVPAFLQVALQAEKPTRQVEVIKFGVPWYNSSHETALLLSNLRDSEDAPDRVVFLNGLNDLVHSVFYQNESPLHPRLSEAWEEQLAGLFAGPPWIRLEPAFPPLRLLAKLQPADNPPFGGERLDGAGDKPSSIRQAARRYERNHRAASALAESFGVDPLFLLQPVPTWLAEDRIATADADYRAFSNYVLESCGPTVLDFRSALGSLETNFAMSVEENGVHYSDAAAQVLANEIAAVVLAEPDSE